jgi:hypothetical protein
MALLRTVVVEAGLLLTVFLFSNCKKEYSYEGGVAVFSMLTANGSCVDPVLSGDYILGSALNLDNTVQLQVNVTVPGRFSLKTNSRSGFLFSASGSLSDTGLQTIILTGSGKPDSTRNFIFSPELPLSCAFPVEVTAQQVQLAGYTLVGAPNACTNIQVVGEYMQGEQLNSGHTVAVNVNVTSPGDYSMHTDMQDGISFSAAGHFSNTGIQVVTMTGSGIPLNPQNLNFSIVGDSTTCTFPLTVENIGNPATYVIESGGNLCIGNLAGSYTAGTAMSAADTYSLTVYVAATGNFTIATQPVNGMVFSYTGTFSTLGKQMVTLIGSGTPVAIGTFTLTPEIVGPHPLGGQACDFDVDVK